MPATHPTVPRLAPAGWAVCVVAARAAAQAWTRFGWDAGRSSAPTTPTGITAANVASLRRQQVAIDGTVDASAIYLHGARVQGRTDDVFFVTTKYGRSEEHTSELQSRLHLVCRLLLEKKKSKT